ncbi:hypothetical protein L218DRAFT_1081125 [Marasmius fiardii PR-910]|nr:hypothetical protein L218DRAFT_1081125 [Marasmius fiardii PR-910]
MTTRISTVKTPTVQASPSQIPIRSGSSLSRRSSTSHNPHDTIDNRELSEEQQAASSMFGSRSPEATAPDLLQEMGSTMRECNLPLSGIGSNSGYVASSNVPSSARTNRRVQLPENRFNSREQSEHSEADTNDHSVYHETDQSSIEGQETVKIEGQSSTEEPENSFTEEEDGTERACDKLRLCYLLKILRDSDFRNYGESVIPTQPVVVVGGTIFSTKDTELTTPTFKPNQEDLDALRSSFPAPEPKEANQDPPQIVPRRGIIGNHYHRGAWGRGAAIRGYRPRTQAGSRVVAGAPSGSPPDGNDSDPDDDPGSRPPNNHGRGLPENSGRGNGNNNNNDCSGGGNGPPDDDGPPSGDDYLQGDESDGERRSGSARRPSQTPNVPIEKPGVFNRT